ncbi:hypothetical protein [Actinoplanes sp. NPDC089786]|uniref:hypothetical protein n=1 Tax=Actinoplanes sp. NPDC089786 TaxID=3155185 RepID=UPI0034413DA2
MDNAIVAMNAAPPDLIAGTIASPPAYERIVLPVPINAEASAAITSHTHHGVPPDRGEGLTEGFT